MNGTEAFVHDTADVAESATVAVGAKIWHYAQVRENASIGENTIVGRGAYVGTGVEVGINCKIQNYALVYEPARLGSGVFIGPAAVLTNDKFPRAISPNGDQKSALDWEAVGVEVGEGASIGANATCIAPLVIGRWALVGSGAIVVRDVPPFALVVGAPAKRIGWVGAAGVPLEADAEDPTLFLCPSTGARYRQTGPDELIEVD
jgi:acetyltransferase-like isoleucine patch superfamily enzyme